MTRLRTAWIQGMDETSASWSRQLKANTGYDYCSLAAKIAGIETEMVLEAARTVKVAVVPITCGQGIISTFPLMKELAEQLDEGMKVLLCPKTTFMLTGTDHAEFVEVDVPGERYSEICFRMPGEARFIGQICNRLLDQEWNKKVTYLKLL